MPLTHDQRLAAYNYGPGPEANSYYRDPVTDRVPANTPQAAVAPFWQPPSDAQYDAAYPSYPRDETFGHLFIVAANKLIGRAALAGEPVYAPRSRSEATGHPIIACRILFSSVLSLKQKLDALEDEFAQTSHEAKDIKAGLARSAAAAAAATAKAEKRAVNRQAQDYTKSPHGRTRPASPPVTALRIQRKGPDAPQRRAKRPASKKKGGVAKKPRQVVKRPNVSKPPAAAAGSPTDSEGAAPRAGSKPSPTQDTVPVDLEDGEEIRLRDSDEGEDDE